MSNYFKYSRTYHLPWSLGSTSDDRILSDVKHFEGQEVVVSSKLDGENSSLYRDHIHARSLDSKHHPSRTWIKALHGQICQDIPIGWRITGENLFATHSIHYRNLESYFYVFGIYNDKNLCLSWDETVEWTTMLGLITVPVLYRGLWDEKAVKACWTGESVASPGDPQEGYVVRIAGSFPYEVQDEGLFSKFTAKFVRENHVQTNSHWLEQAVKPNLLRK